MIVNPVDLDAVSLLAGDHPPNDDEQWCAMELVAYLAGETWSHRPACTCPVLTEFMLHWNDGLPDDERHILLPYLPRLIGTRGSDALAKRRAFMAGDWLIRGYAPAWLRLAQLGAPAEALTSLPEITGATQVASIRGPVESARRDAVAGRDAVMAQVPDAEWERVRAFARAATRATALDALLERTSYTVLGLVAADASGAASNAAICVSDIVALRAARAPRRAFKNTRKELQAGALDLLARMIDAVEPSDVFEERG